MGKHSNSSESKWFIEAKKVIIKKGVEAVNIDELSAKIGVAKTSFYHFFGSKSKFLELLFHKGIQDGTEGVMKVVEKEKSPWERIDKLIHFVMDKNRSNELFLRRLRTYGLHSKKIAQLINETEHRRMEFLQGLLMETGMNDHEASEKAQYFYIYTLGLYERIYAEPKLLNDKEKIYTHLRRILKSDWHLASE